MNRPEIFYMTFFASTEEANAVFDEEEHQIRHSETRRLVLTHISSYMRRLRYEKDHRLYNYTYFSLPIRPGNLPYSSGSLFDNFPNYQTVTGDFISKKPFNLIPFYPYGIENITLGLLYGREIHFDKWRTCFACEILPFGGKTLSQDQITISEEKDFWELLQTPQIQKSNKVLWFPDLRFLIFYDFGEKVSYFYYLDQYSSWSFKAQMYLACFSQGKYPYEMRSELESFQVSIDKILET